LWTTIQVPDKAYPVPAPFISGGAKIVGLGSLYKWAKQEGLAVPEWFERYISRNGEDGEHFLSGKLKATIVYASYWPIDPAYLQLYVWNYRGTNPYRHFSEASAFTESSTKTGGSERFCGVHRSMMTTIGQVGLTIAGSITGLTTIVLAC